jgi:hypothetical protein
MVGALAQDGGVAVDNVGAQSPDQDWAQVAKEFAEDLLKRMPAGIENRPAFLISQHAAVALEVKTRIH